MRKSVRMIVIAGMFLLAVMPVLAYNSPIDSAMWQLDNFFRSEQWRVYGRTIDFFLFFVIFTAVYYIGASWALKKQIEAGARRAVIALSAALGALTTIALMSFTDSAIALLFPFAKNLLFFLMTVVVYALLLKLGMEEKKFLAAITAFAITFAMFNLSNWFICEFVPDTSGPNPEDVDNRCPITDVISESFRPDFGAYGGVGGLWNSVTGGHKGREPGPDGGGRGGTGEGEKEKKPAPTPKKPVITDDNRNTPSVPPTVEIGTSITGYFYIYSANKFAYYGIPDPNNKETFLKKNSKDQAIEEGVIREFSSKCVQVVAPNGMNARVSITVQTNEHPGKAEADKRQQLGEARGDFIVSIVGRGNVYEENGKIYTLTFQPSPSPAMRYYTLTCVAPPELCGNGKIDSGEKCDKGDSAKGISPNLGGKSCQDIDSSYTGGTLKCSQDCSDFDTSGCQKASAKPEDLCGNGKIDSGEKCDKGDSAKGISPNLGGKSCQDIDSSYTGGTLKCSQDCSDFDTSGCQKASAKPEDLCGNGKIDAGEDCDPGNDDIANYIPENLNGKTCEDVVPDKPEGELHCSKNCKFDTSDCKEKKSPEEETPIYKKPIPWLILILLLLLLFYFHRYGMNWWRRRRRRKDLPSGTAEEIIKNLEGLIKRKEEFIQKIREVMKEKRKFVEENVEQFYQTIIAQKKAGKLDVAEFWLPASRETSRVDKLGEELKEFIKVQNDFRKLLQELVAFEFRYWRMLDYLANSETRPRPLEEGSSEEEKQNLRRFVPYSLKEFLADYNQKSNSPKLRALNNIREAEKIMFWIAEIFVVCVRILRHVSELIGDNNERWNERTVVRNVRKWLYEILKSLHDFMRTRHHEAVNTLKSGEKLIEADKQFVMQLMEEFEKAKDELANWERDRKNLAEILEQLSNMLLKLAAPKALYKNERLNPPKLFGDRSLISFEYWSMGKLVSGLRKQIRDIRIIIGMFNESEQESEKIADPKHQIALTGPPAEIFDELQKIRKELSEKEKEITQKLNDAGSQTVRDRQYWERQHKELSELKKRAEKVKIKLEGLQTTETLPEDSKKYYLGQTGSVLKEIEDLLIGVEHIMQNLRFETGASGELVLKAIDAVIKGSQLAGTPLGSRPLDSRGNTVKGLVSFLISELGHLSETEPETRNEEAVKDAIAKIEEAIKSINKEWKKSKLNKA